ncbi:MAG: hypothetical protein P8J50_17665 [Acidimicrobiales bacterium]|jgi:hypothetical protein|nr:hypothetical protein [Acidimicrobiales bacterium]
MVATLPAVRGDADGSAAASSPNPWLIAPNFEVRGGLEQLFITDANPGDPLYAWQRIDDGRSLGVRVLPSTVVDDLGSGMYRELEPGFYGVATGSTVHWIATIEYEGSPASPGAVELFERHADFLGCDAGAAVAGPDLDLEAVLAGTDTNTQSISAGCASGAEVELWTIEGGIHIPFFTADYAAGVLDWFFSTS